MLESYDITVPQGTPCRLYNEFFAGLDVGEYSLCLIATNLRIIQGGREMFILQLERVFKPKVVGKMTGYMNYIIENDYKPANCSKCKYYPECHAAGFSKGNMAATLVQFYSENLPVS